MSAGPSLRPSVGVTECYARDRDVFSEYCRVNTLYGLVQCSCYRRAVFIMDIELHLLFIHIWGLNSEEAICQKRCFRL